MTPSRVLIVDDAVVVRRMLGSIIEREEGLTLAGTATNGQEALDMLATAKPDIIILDINMPVMDGLETLKHLRRSHPKLPVIMFSTYTERGAIATIDALAAGASDYVTKPSGTDSSENMTDQIRTALVPRLRVLCRILEPTTSVPAVGHDVINKTRSTLADTGQKQKYLSEKRVDAVVIGVSTGGPNALGMVVPRLPAGLPVPILIVQHMPPLFTAQLAESLNRNSPLPVSEGQNQQKILPGHVYLAPGDFHMILERQGTDVIIRTNQNPPENSCRPAVDPLFRSAAKIFGKNTLGVILTGMGSDGLRGSQDIVTAGGSIIAQDEATSTVWGMPGQVAKHGLTEKILPVENIADEISRYLKAGR